MSGGGTYLKVKGGVVLLTCVLGRNNYHVVKLLVFQNTFNQKNRNVFAF